MSEIKDRIISRTYKNSNGRYKDRIRRRINQYISNSNINTPLILTLPGTDWIWEKSILQSIPSAVFIGVEQDSVISEQVVINSLDISRNVEAVYNEPLVNVLKKSVANNYSHIIMDYCGTINSVYDEIEYTLENDLVTVDGTIHITLSKMNINPSTLISNISDKLSPYALGFNGSKSSVSTKLLISYLIIKHMRYRLLNVFEYHDTSSMIVFSIRRDI